MEVIVLDGHSMPQLQPSAIAIGFFDGLHLGHMQLIQQVESIAQTKGLKKGLMTFSVHPKVVFGQHDFRYLMSLHQKKQIIEDLGFDYFFIIDFDSNVAALSPEDFINQYIKNTNIQHIVCGFDFNFGKYGKGNYNTLKELSNDQYVVDVVDKYEYNHEKVSSSIIREYIGNGEIELANYLLSRPYRITGRVIHGRKNGRKMGFPTANVEIGHFVELKKGVYASYVYYKGKKYKAMANVGYNPTLGSLNKISLEVNIFDFHEDIYDEIIAVEFIKYTRPEQKFISVEYLIQQLTSDRKDIDQLLD